MADESFNVLVVEDDSSASRLVQAIVEGRGHQVEAVADAEGIETEGQFALLQNLGCDIGQDCLISRPLDPERAFLLTEKKGFLL
jgi:EAL domain-containing protein (putative c-di-GMP-specific phosphodiesterase class I)